MTNKRFERIRKRIRAMEQKKRRRSMALLNCCCLVLSVSLIGLLTDMQVPGNIVVSRGYSSVFAGGQGNPSILIGTVCFFAGAILAALYRTFKTKAEADANR